jgi:adenylate cyclase
MMRRSLIYWLPVMLLVVVALARLVMPSTLDRMALPAFDFFNWAVPRETPDDPPVLIVDIDERSLQQIGQWPWPRTVLAQLIAKLREAGAADIGFDILFTEKDRTSPQMLLALLTSRGVAEDEAKRLLAAMPDPDVQLAAEMARSPIVVGFNLVNEDAGTMPLRKAGYSSVGQAGADGLRFVEKFKGAISALPEFQKAAAGVGFVNQLSDWVNVVRKVPLVLRLGNTEYPSLAMEALRVGLGARGYILRYAGAQAEASYGGVRENRGLNAVEIQIPGGGVKPIEIPVDNKGQVTLRYAQRDPRRYVSATDVLSGNFDPKRVADHIVLVGASAAGLNDLKATPLASDMPGVEIHAQLLEQIFQENFLFRPDWGYGAELVFTVIMAILVIIAVPRVGALESSFVALTAMLIAAGTAWVAFRYYDVLIDPVYPITVLAMIYTFCTVLNYRLTERRQREVREAFSRYLSPHYVEELAKNPEKLVLGGEIRLMTIMFCDIRGFTTLSEGLSAHDLGMLINSFLTPMTEIIMEHKGTIDKYIGDCIMAFWNAPLDDPDHAKNAVAAAMEMRIKLDELNRAWVAEGRREIHIGIGINSGECSVGNFGSNQKFNYSLLGDPVNLSSRLEGLTKMYGVDLIIGEGTAAHLDDPNLIELDLVAVKGKTRAVRIFTLPPHQIEAQQYLTRHAALLEAYRKRDWKGALGLLEDPVLAKERDMAGLYGLFRERIEQMQIESPPPDWDGVFVAHEK